jgi:predicted component of type VI protein secretion system
MRPSASPQAAHLLLSSAGLALRTLPLMRERTTIGRRPYNDLVLDDLTVSGEHAVILCQDGQWWLRDLRSRNGTRVNGAVVTEHLLTDGDRIGIGVYLLVFSPSGAEASAASTEVALIEMLDGAQAGTIVRLDRPITSLGQVGAQMAVVVRRRDGYHLTHLEGAAFPLVNGASTGLLACPLAHDDLIDLGGTLMRFRLPA